MQYKYNIDDIVNNFIIKDRYYVSKNREKRYKIECIKCHNISDKIEKQIVKRGCSYCNGHRFIKGYNDIATVRPDLIKYFRNPIDAENISLGSCKQCELKCPNCGYEFTVERIRTIANHTWKCPHCGNRGSFNERLMKSILNYYNIDFMPEKIFEWAKQYRYDFYIPQYNCIIELHGLQHYTNIHSAIFNVDVAKQQQIDQNKEQLAKLHGYSYIIIDCKKSNYNYFLNSIKQSNFCQITNISYDDILSHFNEIICCSNYTDIENCVNLYQQGYSTKEIVVMLNISLPTISKYLKIADKLNMIQFNDISIEKFRKERAAKQIHKTYTKNIICLETLKQYDTYTDVANDLQCARISVSKCCNHKQHFIISKKDNKEYHVMLYEEYIKLSQQEIQDIINFKQKRSNQFSKNI